MIRTGHNITLSVQIKIKKHGVTPARLYLICKSFRAATRLAFFWEYFVRLNEKCVFSFGSKGPRDAPEQLNWQVIQLHQQNRWCEIERNRQFCLTKYVFPHVSYSSCLFFALFCFLFHLVCRDQDGNMSDIPQIWSSSKENIHQTKVSEGKHFPGLCEEGITCNIYTVKCLQTTRHCYTCCYVLILTLSQLLTTFKPR